MRTFAIILTFFLVSVPELVGGQVVQQVNQVRVGGPLTIGVDDDQMELTMRMEIDAIQRVTGISDAAVKKLEVASKAAIQSLSKKQQASFQGFPGLKPAKPDSAATELSDEEAEQKNKPADNPANNGPFPPPLNIFASSPEAVKKEEIWAKTLANVLNQEQSANYKKFLEARQAHVRRQAVRNYVEQMDTYLMLTDGQRESLTQIVDQKMGEDLAKQQVVNRAGMGGAMVIMIAGANLKSLKSDDLSDVLSPVQLAEFKRQQDQVIAGPLGALPGMPGVKPAKRGAKEQSEKFTSNLGFTAEEADGRLVIREVKPDSAAEQAGLRSGDLIDSLDDNPVDTLVQLKRALSKVGKKWEMQIRRNDQLIKVSNE